MKVLDLQCAQQHLFEGWFASEVDFSDQRSRGLIHCPMCGNADIIKRLSAPRLNFGVPHGVSEHEPATPVAPSTTSSAVAQRMWLQACQVILANTVEVGAGFTEAARKMHYGEAPPRAIRGQATVQQAQALIDEGIEVLPFVLPQSMLGTHH